MRLALQFWFAATLLAVICTPADAQRAARTTVIVLGVAHSNQLVTPAYEPAITRAFIQKVRPDAICIERDPENVARNDHYEFTYEIQSIAIPYARQAGIEICPFDWSARAEDDLLAFGVYFEIPAPVRRYNPGGALRTSFFTVDDSASLNRDLFFAERSETWTEYESWYATPDSMAARDIYRRHFLYRTYLQARRIAKAVERHPGGRIMVLVGAFHKRDIDQILAADSNINVVQPSTIGAPTPDEVALARLPEFDFAIASFNILGVQSRVGKTDGVWLGTVLERIRKLPITPEADLISTRALVLAGKIDAATALTIYESVAKKARDERFTWDPVKFRDRIDSYSDPFGNLNVRQRARLEQARELLRLNRAAEAQVIKTKLRGELAFTQRVQLDAYWDEFVAR